MRSRYRMTSLVDSRAPDVNNLHVSVREPSRAEEFEAADVGHRRWKTTRVRLGAASSNEDYLRQVL